MTDESNAAAGGSEPFRLERDGDVAQMVLEHPPLNLFDASTFDSLEACVDELTSAPPRTLLVRAEGRFVSAGVDVAEFDGLSAAAGGQLWSRLVGLVRQVEALPCPTVFCAHALTLTAAFELALGCDLIVAGRAAKFGLVENVIGLSPGMGGTQRLAERAGPARAREFVMTGDTYDAETLHSWGVVNWVWDDGELGERTEALVARLAAGPTLAHTATKQMVRAQVEGGVDHADAAMPQLSGSLFGTEDLKRAVKTFLAEGPGHATFDGRG
jgi:enoyl-CoA hydratase/carnithine racemase